jgi:E3 ubiquitin-protein ligase MYCBP2
MCEISSSDPSDLLRSATGNHATPTNDLSSCVCRFCSSPGANRLTQVCDNVDCRSNVAIACSQTHTDCAHLCGGVVGEKQCLPCMKCARDTRLRQDADDLCVICFTDRLGAAPCVLLQCGHVFHYACVRQSLTKRWHGPRITFAFMRCPLCQTSIVHETLEDLLQPLQVLYNDVVSKAKIRLEYDGLAKAPAVVNTSSQFHNDPLSYALEKYMYVLCSKCGKAYYGGEAQCLVRYL